jgi:HlyD family secretion protein
VDTTRNTQPQKRRRKLWVGAAVLAGISFTAFVFSMDFTTLRVDRENLRIGTVVRGEFEIKVSGNGTLEPVNVESLASRVEGRVTQIHLKPGAQIEQGEPLVSLSSPTLITALEDARAALTGGRARLTARQGELEAQLLDLRSAVLRAEFAWKSSNLELWAETKLMALPNTPITEVQYKRTQLEETQWRETLVIERERMVLTRKNVQAQLAAEQARVSQLQKALEQASINAEALILRAGMSGIVQSLPLEIGQQVSAGSQVARIANQQQLYAELEIPATQASELAVGQAVEVDTRNGVVDGTISRVAPSVINGTVVVDVSLPVDLPKGSRPALRVDGIIYITRLSNTLSVGKPSYVKEDSRTHLFRLDVQGRYAERIAVNLGKASVNRIQVADGLESGDRIILSDSRDWQDRDRIYLN